MNENENTENTEMTAGDFISQLNDMKANMVSKTDYDRLKEDNRQLTNALINGTGAEIPGVTAPKEKTDLDALRTKLFTKKCKNDLDYFQTVLELRDGVMNDGHPDPFLPYNRNYIPSQQDIQDAERIASQIRDAIDYADGDPSVFSNDLKRRCGVRR